MQNLIQSPLANCQIIGGVNFEDLDYKQVENAHKSTRRPLILVFNYHKQELPEGWKLFTSIEDIALLKTKLGKGSYSEFASSSIKPMFKLNENTASFGGLHSYLQNEEALRKVLLHADAHFKGSYRIITNLKECCEKVNPLPGKSIRFKNLTGTDMLLTIHVRNI